MRMNMLLNKTKNMISKYTVIFCLNECIGETVMSNDDFNKHYINNIKNRFIIFSHDLEHEGYNTTFKPL